MIREQRYAIYFNSSATNVIHAADCVLIEEDGHLTLVFFKYTLDYLNCANACAIDPRLLPISADTFRLECRGGIPGFLDDYLPDDWGKRVLAQLAFYQHEIAYNANSIIDTLALVGTSHIGALSIVRKGDLPTFGDGAPITELSASELTAQKIDADDYDGVSFDELGLLHLAHCGSGVGGARPKALINDGTSRYLAKFNRLNEDKYNNARVELACLKMATSAGLKVSDGYVVPGINDREVLLVDRFDVDEHNHRRHIVSINTLLKDSSQRDFGRAFRYDDIYHLLQQFSTDIASDLSQLFSLMIFNRMINNIDDHERNFSMQCAGDGFTLAPAYDLVPSLARGKYHVAGYDYSPTPPSPSRAIALGKVFGLPKPVVKACVDRVSSAGRLWPSFAESAGVSEEQMEMLTSVFHY